MSSCSDRWAWGWLSEERKEVGGGDEWNLWGVWGPKISVYKAGRKGTKGIPSIFLIFGGSRVGLGWAGHHTRIFSLSSPIPPAKHYRLHCCCCCRRRLLVGGLGGL